jgi:UDP-N-acetylglucosamine acyltransferase
VAHDCLVESNVTLSSGVLLGGHVAVERNVNIGGATAINQFTTIGRFAFLGGLTRIVHDVPPFLIVEGNPAETRAVNRIGMQRGGIPDDVIEAVDKAYRLLYRSRKPFVKAFEDLAAQRGQVREVDMFIAAIERAAAGKKGRAQEGER